jgi:hypothetical protein
VECGAEIKLKSFRAAPLRCPNCDKVSHDTFGCLGLGLAGGVVFGLLGFGIGRLLAPLVQIPFFAARLTVVAIFDGIGLAGLMYWRSRPHAGRYGPLYAFLMFSVIAARASRGHGIRHTLIWAISNGIVGLSLSWLLLAKRGSSVDGSCKRSADVASRQQGSRHDVMSSGENAIND